MGLAVSSNDHEDLHVKNNNNNNNNSKTSNKSSSNHHMNNVDDTSSSLSLSLSSSSSHQQPSPQDFVLTKIMNSRQFQQKLGSNLQLMRSFARQISDVEELKSSYLSTDWLHTVQLYRETTTNTTGHCAIRDDEGVGADSGSSLLTSSLGMTSQSGSGNVSGMSGVNGGGMNGGGESSTSHVRYDSFNSLLGIKSTDTMGDVMQVQDSTPQQQQYYSSSNSNNNNNNSSNNSPSIILAQQQQRQSPPPFLSSSTFSPFSISTSQQQQQQQDSVTTNDEKVVVTETTSIDALFGDDVNYTNDGDDANNQQQQQQQNENASVVNLDGSFLNNLNNSDNTNNQNNSQKPNSNNNNNNNNTTFFDSVLQLHPITHHHHKFLQQHHPHVLNSQASLDNSTSNIRNIHSINNSHSSNSHSTSFFEEIPERELDSLKNLVFMQKIRIKLLIAETGNTSSKRALRQLVSPLLNSMNVLPELGMFHSALIIGPWKLEFNDSGVVVPRKIISSAAVLTADIDHITTVNRFNDIVNKLAEVIVKWNTTMQYKESGGDKSKVGNCQNFVDDVLQALDIKLNFSGPMAQFIERLRKTGKCSLQFEPDATFTERYELQERVYRFTDHESLDRFATELLRKNPNAIMEHRSEWALLKSFDRALWLKNARFPDRKEYMPCQDEKTGKLACPFGDPTQYSFINV